MKYKYKKYFMTKKQKERYHKSFVSDFVSALAEVVVSHGLLDAMTSAIIEPSKKKEDSK